MASTSDPYPKACVTLLDAWATKALLTFALAAAGAAFPLVPRSLIISMGEAILILTIWARGGCGRGKDEGAKAQEAAQLV